MTEFFYPTASTVAVFINGYHVDQAFRIDYKESSYKIPVFGYNDFVYTTVAQSKTMIQGMLVVNFTFPGYLLPVLERTADSRHKSVNLYNTENLYSDIKTRYNNKKAKENIVAEQLSSELPGNLDQTERAARAEFIAGLISNPNTRKETKEALNKHFIKRDNKPGKLHKIIDSPVFRDGSLPFGSIIDVYYQDPDYSTWSIRFSDVYFNDVTQQINQAGAAGSAENLYEIYSFISSRKDIVLL